MLDDTAGSADVADPFAGDLQIIKDIEEKEYPEMGSTLHIEVNVEL